MNARRRHGTARILTRVAMTAAASDDGEDNKVFVAVRVRPLNASERNASVSAWNVVSTNAIASQVRRKKRNEINVMHARGFHWRRVDGKYVCDGSRA